MQMRVIMTEWSYSGHPRSDDALRLRLRLGGHTLKSAKAIVPVRARRSRSVWTKGACRTAVPGPRGRFAQAHEPRGMPGTQSVVV